MAEFLGADEKELMLLWLSDKIADSIEGEDLGLEALRYVKNRMMNMDL